MANVTNPYTTVSVSNYNANPPADDGTNTPTNQLEWAKHKTKLGDPLKTAIESVNSNAQGAFAVVANRSGDESNQFAGSIGFARTELTLATDLRVTPTRSLHTIDTTADGATGALDYLATSGVEDGALVWLLAENSGRVVTVRGSGGDATATDANILLAGNRSFDLDTGYAAMLRLDTSNWREVQRPVSAIQSTPGNPAFLAHLATTATGVTGDGTEYTIIFDAEVADRASNYLATTGVFTAPVTGLYRFETGLRASGMSGATQMNTRVETSNASYAINDNSPSTDMSQSLAITADMDAGDTAKVVLNVGGIGSKTVDLSSTAANVRSTYFSGSLVP